MFWYFAAYISEDSQIGTYLAYVSANDLDNGNNGEVALTIWTQQITETGTCFYHTEQKLMVKAKQFKLTLTYF